LQATYHSHGIRALPCEALLRSVVTLKAKRRFAQLLLYLPRLALDLSLDAAADDSAL
jgi:hypothetical protein